MSYFTANLRLEEEEVRAELARQNAKFGRQDHPDLDPRDIDIVTRHHYAGYAERWKQVNAERAQPTTGDRCAKDAAPHTHTAWDGILLEEVYEALAEPDPEKLLAELLQVEAVARQWRIAIRRRLAIEEASG